MKAATTLHVPGSLDRASKSAQGFWDVWTSSPPVHYRVTDQSQAVRILRLANRGETVVPG